MRTKKRETQTKRFLTLIITQKIERKKNYEKEISFKKRNKRKNRRRFIRFRFCYGRFIIYLFIYFSVLGDLNGRKIKYDGRIPKAR